MAPDTLMDWFLAAMLHDIGKTLISERGWWENYHGNLNRARNGDISFATLLSSDMIAKIRAHDWKPPQGDPKANGLIMADRLQKAMYESLVEYQESTVEDVL